MGMEFMRASVKSGGEFCRLLPRRGHLWRWQVADGEIFDAIEKANREGR